MCAVLVAEAVCVATNNAGATVRTIFFVFAFKGLLQLGLDGLPASRCAHQRSCR
jgi:hypothetical protein